MLSVGSLIWVSTRPILKMALSTAFGFILTKCDLFSAAAARGAGQVILNITIPGLMFSKIVTAITTDKIAALGPLILIGALYELIGLLLAFLVRQLFWVPHRFRYGILVAGCWGNWGDIPTAVVMSITAASPFNAQKDSDIAVAYIAMFILVFYVSLFPLGGILVAKDFKGPDLTDDEVREPFTTKAKKTAKSIAQLPSTVGNLLRNRRRPQTDKVDNMERAQPQPTEKSDREAAPSISGESKFKPTTPTATVVDGDIQSDTDGEIRRLDGSRRVTFLPDDEKTIREDGAGTNPAANSYAGTIVAPASADDVDTMKTAPTQKDLEGLELGSGTNRTFLQRVLSWLRTLLIPPTITIFLSFPIALVPQLKNLFITVTESPRGPDGQAALSFVMDTAIFLGNASVPLGLVCLGSALARLTIPRPFTRLPLGAIGTFTIAKMIILPILGVLVTELFTYGIPLIDPNDKVLRFVCIFFSSVPTATTQVFLTQIASPDGNAEHLSAFLVPQYALMFLSMTTLNAYALHLLFP
ncbi:Protein M3 [Tulasnella sp. 418]|nr:Protein M3 [Tulasnella sp. 418]